MNLSTHTPQKPELILDTGPCIQTIGIPFLRDLVFTASEHLDWYDNALKTLSVFL